MEADIGEAPVSVTLHDRMHVIQAATSDDLVKVKWLKQRPGSKKLVMNSPSAAELCEA